MACLIVREVTQTDKRSCVDGARAGWLRRAGCPATAVSLYISSNRPATTHVNPRGSPGS
jgi:hypothetical protein